LKGILGYLREVSYKTGEDHNLFCHLTWNEIRTNQRHGFGSEKIAYDNISAGIPSIVIKNRRLNMKTLTKYLLITALILFITTQAWAEKVIFTTSDGYKITGTLTKPDKKSVAGVVLLHMYTHKKEDWKPLIPYLTELGITTLAIDMRGHGESNIAPNGKDITDKVINRDKVLFNQMRMDAEGAVKYLIQKAGIDPKHIGLIGASVGCSVAIQTVVEKSVKISAVTVMTPGKDYLGVPTIVHIQTWSKTPILILSSKEEAETGANLIHNWLKGQGAEIRLFDERDIHGTYMFGKVKGIEKLIADWMGGRLLQ
jgi:dienelactone hydrolase